MIFLDGGPTIHKSLPEEQPPGPVSASRAVEFGTLNELYEAVILLSIKCRETGWPVSRHGFQFWLDAGAEDNAG